jgi:AAR2 protein
MYEFENITRWKNLTNLINEDVVKRLSPSSGIIRNSVEFKSCEDKDKPETPIRNVKIRSNDDEAMYLPQMEVIAESQPKFTKLPERYNRNSSPAEKTLNNIDTINLIDKIFNEITPKQQLLEELQFSFIIYLCALSVDSLAHWRQILSLLCNSETAVEKHKLFYKQLVTVIKHQIPEIPIEFIEQCTSNTIYLDLKNLLKNLMVNNCLDIAISLQKHLDETIAWTFDDLLEEDPEDQPQIVDM